MPIAPGMLRIWIEAAAVNFPGRLMVQGLYQFKPPLLFVSEMETVAQRLRDRGVAGLMTTFASDYSHEVFLADALKPDVIAVYNKRATGEKYLICPHKV